MGFRTAEGIGRRIAQLREDAGISQRRLAAAIGLDPSALSRVENGARGLAVGELTAIADHLGVDLESILRDDEEAVMLRGEADEESVQSAIVLFDRVIADFFALEAAAG